ncbi:MAG: SIS domain-containing protein [Angustibacter sp.]
MTAQPTAYADDVVRGASHTTQEIAQQPALWRQVGEVVAAARSFVDPLVGRPDLRVVLTGAGTSSFAGEVVAPALRRHLPCRVDAVSTTDIVAAPEDCFSQDVPTLLVSFARSGDSPESVAATDLADQLLTEVHHLVLTCNPTGQLAGRYGDHDRAHVALMPDGANDQGFAMTSSFTTMALTALLALAPAVDQDLATRLAGVVDEVMGPWDALAGQLAGRGYERIVYLGSGALKGLAHESALKVLELTDGRALAMGDSPLAFRHGPKSVLDDETLVVVYLSNDAYTRTYDLDLLAELRESRGDEHVLAVTADHGDDVSASTPLLLAGCRDLPDTALALAAVVLAQLVALRFSMALGLTADNPFPSGEVNRVVQGVRIHAYEPRR